MCLSTSNNLSAVSTFKLPYTKLPSDDGKLCIVYSQSHFKLQCHVLVMFSINFAFIFFIGKFMSTEETALHFQKLTSERESRWGGVPCDKEVQTDAQ